MRSPITPSGPGAHAQPTTGTLLAYFSRYFLSYAGREPTVSETTMLQTGLAGKEWVGEGIGGQALPEAVGGWPTIPRAGEGQGKGGKGEGGRQGGHPTRKGGKLEPYNGEADYSLYDHFTPQTGNWLVCALLPLEDRSFLLITSRFHPPGQG